MVCSEFMVWTCLFTMIALQLIVARFCFFVGDCNLGPLSHLAICIFGTARQYIFCSPLVCWKVENLNDVVLEDRLWDFL